MADPRGLRILYLATDAYGGHGGIAHYSRNFIEALDADSRVARIICLPRKVSGDIGPLPPKLSYDLRGITGRCAYIIALLRLIVTQRFDVVIVAHLNLAPLGWMAARLQRVPWLLSLHGIEAWPEFASHQRRFFAQRADHVVSVSKLTLTRFQSWCPIDRGRASVIPNALNLAAFSPGPRDPVLEGRYALQGKKVIMTLGRLDPDERYKGFDEVIDALPALLPRHPNLIYLIAGQGGDQARLAAKAAAMGLSAHVRFTGMVAECEKAATYRLADVYAMPSMGEGFGFVFLEAMACGIPVIASALDGGREAVADGALGQIVDPRDRDALVAAIDRALDQPKQVPMGLSDFGIAPYRARISALLSDLIRPS